MSKSNSKYKIRHYLSNRAERGTIPFLAEEARSVTNRGCPSFVQNAHITARFLVIVPLSSVKVRLWIVFFSVQKWRSKTCPLKIGQKRSRIHIYRESALRLFLYRIWRTGSGHFTEWSVQKKTSYIYPKTVRSGLKMAYM